MYIPRIEAKPVRGIYKSKLPEYKDRVGVDKVNGGKADALNVGINVARYEYVCCIDADSILEDDALQKVMKPFLEDDRGYRCRRDRAHCERVRGHQWQSR